MLITKKINNSVAMAQDAEGHELVVFGKGIGFPAVPYELADESCIQRVFRHVNDDLMQTIASISPEMLEAALDIVRMAERELDCKLNPNLYLMLADHLQFSADRFARGIVIENPLAGEIPFVYPHEYELGQAGVRIVEGVTGKEMPEQEACSIALHVANAELGGGFSASMHTVMEDVEIIDTVVDILQSKLDATFDKSSHGYLRFVAHLRYLIQRLRKGEEVPQADNSLIDQVKKDFPHAYSAARTVARHLRRKRGWRLSNEELLYLVLYINRLMSGV